MRKQTKVWSDNQKMGHLFAFSLNGRIILHEILSKYCTSVGNGFNMFRIGLVMGSVTV
jgi:hypothetical protein